jgi:hypothetical protein
MSIQYRCGTEKRRQDVAASATINGIDFLEVSPDQKTLLVHFLHDLSGFPALKADNVVVLGGVRVKNIRVTGVTPAGSLLTITVTQPGDFSIYTLALRTSASDSTPPSGYDLQLSSVTFSFKAGCPSEFDCLPPHDCPPSGGIDPELDYLAKDYDSFRLLMLDRMATIMPGWQERNSADVGIALVELLAYVADQLSYFQDAVATEAYLGTARKRVSVRRHARLLDYRIGDGSSARAWMFFQTSAAMVTVPAGTAISSHHDPGALAAPPVVFETMDELTARSAHNEIGIYTWGDEGCCLPKGATRATLVDLGGVSLQPGDLVLFEEIISPTTGAAADADATHRQVVRLTKIAAGNDPLYNASILEVEWDVRDALDFPLCLSALVPDPNDPTGPEILAAVAVARGNVVLADHGQTVGPEPLLPAIVPPEGAYRPQLSRSPLTFRVPQTTAEHVAPAAAAMVVDPSTALPDITLAGEGTTWQPQYDLLDSDRLKPEFVVESESDGAVQLRFGDGVHGRRPAPGSSFTATFRIGTGGVGNVGREVLTVLSLAGIDLVRNPLPATGGSDPEPIERIKQMAPWAIQTQERAVTAADYADRAQRHPEVRKAVARFRWTGSWYAVSVSIERTGGRALDPLFEADLRRFLNTFRMAGHDLEFVDAIHVPVDLTLNVCVKPGYFRSDVKRALADVLGSRPLPGGGAGFFIPDHFAFGEPLYLSQVYQAALTVAGVAFVNASSFKRWGRSDSGELAAAVLRVSDNEVIRLDNDPNFPENGRLELALEGGQ